MKPNAEQQQFIRHQLQGMLKVRETYEELYDHILTALEEMPDNILFHDTVNQILEHDLGGKRGIQSMQARMLGIARKDFAGYYFMHLMESFKSVTVLIILAITAAYCFLLKADIVGQQMVYLIIPSGLAYRLLVYKKVDMDWRLFKIDYAMNRVRSSAAILLFNLPCLLWLLINIICGYLQDVNIITDTPGPNHLPIIADATIFLIGLLNAHTFYKLYKGLPKYSIINS